MPRVGSRGRVLEVEWTTITYRTIALYVSAALALVAFTLYVIAPRFTKQKILQGLEAMVGDAGKVSNPGAAATRREAHFVNLDGTVRVKKARSLEWIRADYNTNLEQGDFVQTAGDGVARIIFADGTNYILKPDALIVVEESREDPVTRATKVSVQVSSGAVDLATPRFSSPGSTSQVAIADAVARLNEESRAAVRNDPDNNVHEITMNTGQAEVTRGSTTIQLGQYEQATFDAQKAGLLKSKVMAPPTLLTPENMDLQMVKDAKTAVLEFTWREVPGAKSYHLLISPSPVLSNFAVDKKVIGKTSQEVSGLEAGSYWWTVAAIDEKGAESQPSPANKLSLVEQVTGSEAYLEVTKIILHGKVVEVLGKTEPGSTVIINNEQVFSISPDGTFRQFMSPLAKSGEHQITITAQDRKGNTNTIRKSIVIQ
jgi:hypothetical protein